MVFSIRGTLTSGNVVTTTPAGLMASASNDFDDLWDVPGVPMTYFGYTEPIFLSNACYFPFVVEQPITISSARMAIKTSPPNTGNTAWLSIYSTGTNWKPTGLVANLGQVNISSSGFKYANVTATLNRGLYVYKVHPSTPFLPVCYIGSSPAGAAQLNDIGYPGFVGAYFKNTNVAFGPPQATDSTYTDLGNTGDDHSIYPVQFKYTVHDLAAPSVWPGDTVTALPLANSTGTVTHNLNLSRTFVHSNIVANFAADFTNAPTTDNRSTTVTLVYRQGANSYRANVFKVDGTEVTNVSWKASNVMTNNGVDVVQVQLLRTGNQWLSIVK